MSDHVYKLKYDLEFEAGEFSSGDLTAGGHGGTDALFFASFIYPENGTFSLDWHTLDGRTNEPLSDREVFKMWSLLATQLAENRDGSIFPWQQRIAKKAADMVRGIVTEGRKPS